MGTHLIFADDVLLFCKGDRESIDAIFKGITLFSSFSGLIPNPRKSQCFFGNVPPVVMNFATQLTGFQCASLPIKYLGLPLFDTKPTAVICVPLISRLCQMIDHWTCKFLSTSGRLQLLNTVLFGIQSYWSAYLFLSKGILNRAKSLLANFLWGGTHRSSSMHKVSWSECCLPKSEGGLGIRDPIIWNIAAIYHQIWRIIQPASSSLWVTWFHSCLLRNKPFWTAKMPSKCPWSARQILNARPLALPHLQYHVGVNSGFYYWHDPLIQNCPLLERFGPSIASVMDIPNRARAGLVMNNEDWIYFGSNHVDAIEVRHLPINIRIVDRDAITWDSRVKNGSNAPRFTNLLGLQ